MYSGPQTQYWRMCSRSCARSSSDSGCPDTMTKPSVIAVRFMRSIAHVSPRACRSKTSAPPCVRDAILGRDLGARDLDFATDAPPHETTRVLRGWAERQYLVGVRFGTVGARRGDRRLEITTFRQEAYAADDRKPSVTFARDVETDLSRRDFTMNAMAISLPDGAFVDPFGGVRDLAARRLDTPLDPDVAF